MELKDFAVKVCHAVEGGLGKDYHVELQEVKKNNGVILHGLLIKNQVKNIVPTIYLETFWEAYESGIAFSEIVRRLIAIYRENVPDEGVDMGFFRSFDRVKDRICYRLVGRKENEELLEDIPYIEFLDLAICFYYAYQEENLGEGSILVHNFHMEMWKTCTAELLKLAQNNTPRLFPWECVSLEEILSEIAGEDVCEGRRGEDSCDGGYLPEESIFVLSNTKKVQGAVCMIYPEVLEKIAGEYRRNIYILPSSVHEVLLLADTGSEREEALKRMIAEVNNTQVAPEEVLSDNLYCYDYTEKRVKIIF